MGLEEAAVEGAMETGRDRTSRLYESHIAEAVRLAYLLTGEREVAEDVAQDSFVRAAGRFQHLREETAFRKYLLRSVVNACRGHWRRRQVEQRYVASLSHGRPGVTQAEDVPARLAVTQMLAELSPRQRSAVVLRHYLDLSEAQTAELMGCSVGTVKTLVSRGLKVLRERMQP
jgi:RNA polymerase sigma-70 factor (sigma-E family)